MWMFISLAKYVIASSLIKRRQISISSQLHTQMRLLMAQYSELPDEERDLWERAQANEKARYEREMLAYVPPSTPAEGSEDDDPIRESGGMEVTGAMPPLALAAAAEDEVA